MWAIAAISAKTCNESFVITGYDSKDDIDIAMEYTLQ